MHIKNMLAKAKSDQPISAIEARDAMLGCFVTIHGETLKRGAQILGKALDDEQTEKHATVIMKGILGADWDRPTSKSLHDARIQMDRKMHFSQAPADLQDMHEQVCTRIVSKI